MIRLSQLQELGCISSAYREVDYHSTRAVSLTELSTWSTERKARFDGVVISDNCLWAATLEKIPLMDATKVYTSDGERVCCWDKKRRMLFIKKLHNSQLVTIDQLVLPIKNENKEEKIMANEINLDGIENMDFDGIGVAPAAPASSAGAKTSQSDANKTFIENMNKQSIALNNDASVMMYNYQHGRAMGFITTTDRAVRMSLAKLYKKDAQGNRILKDDAPDAIKKQYNDYLAKVEGVKCPPAAYFQTEYGFKFREAKPGKILGMIIGMPSKTANIGFNSIIEGTATVTDDGTPDKDLVVKIIPMEQAYDVILNAFDGAIVESEGVLGNRATELVVNGRVDTKKVAQGVTAGAAIRYSLKVEKSATRATLLTEGNYVPAKTYKTLSQNKINSAEDAQMLNNNVLAIFKDKTDKLAELSEDAKKVIIGQGTGAKYFNAGADQAPIGEVAAFDGSGVLSSVEVTVRTRKENEKKGTVSYPYVYETDFATIAKKPQFKAVIDNAKLDAATIQEQIKKLSKSTKASTGSSRVTSLDIATLQKYSQTKKENIKEIAKLLAASK